MQDYLKSIFDKVGVRNRRQLTGLIFREHYEPRAWRGDRLSADGWFVGAAQPETDRSAAAGGRVASR